MPTNRFPARYGLLDGLRGIAALGVVLTHHGVVAWGHDAVLVFFIISGYCITAAAHAALERDTGNSVFRYFMWRRLRRIYPPYFLSLVFFAATRLIRNQLTSGAPVPTDALLWLRNLTLTQWTALVYHPAPPTANPALLVTAYWSLNYEEQFYLVVALALVACGASARRLQWLLYAVTAASIAWLAVVGVDVYHGVFPEYWPHFALGVLLYGALVLTDRAAWRRALGVALLLLAVLTGAAATGAVSFAAPDRAREIAVLALTGLALLALRPFSAAIEKHVLWRPVAYLGTISYSLYLVHQFNLHASETVGSVLARALLAPALAMPLAIAVQIGIASVFWRFCERPFLNPGAARRAS